MNKKILILLFIFIACNNIYIYAAKPLNNVLVVIDPGHGGRFNNAVAVDGTKEKDLALQQALKLKEKLKELGAKVLLSRESDVDFGGTNSDDDVTKRWDEIKKVLDNEWNPTTQKLIFVILHFNGGKSKGTETFFYQSGGTADWSDFPIATQINSELVKLGFKDRRSPGADPNDWYLLKESYKYQETRKGEIATAYSEICYIDANPDWTKYNQLKDKQIPRALMIDILRHLNKIETVTIQAESSENTLTDLERVGNIVKITTSVVNNVQPNFPNYSSTLLGHHKQLGWQTLISNEVRGAQDSFQMNINAAEYGNPSDYTDLKIIGGGNPYLYESLMPLPPEGTIYTLDFYYSLQGQVSGGYTALYFYFFLEGAVVDFHLKVPPIDWSAFYMGYEKIAENIKGTHRIRVQVDVSQNKTDVQFDDSPIQTIYGLGFGPERNGFRASIYKEDGSSANISLSVNNVKISVFKHPNSGTLMTFWKNVSDLNKYLDFSPTQKLNSGTIKYEYTTDGTNWSAIDNFEDFYVNESPAGIISYDGISSANVSSKKIKFRATLTKASSDAESPELDKMVFEYIKSNDEPATLSASNSDTILANSETSSANADSTEQADTQLALFKAPEPDFVLGENYSYPNPAKRGANPKIHIECGVADKLEIILYNVAGEIIKSEQLAGNNYQIVSNKYCYEQPIEVSDIASGVYIYTIKAEKENEKPIKAQGKIAIIK